MFHPVCIGTSELKRAKVFYDPGVAELAAKSQIRAILAGSAAATVQPVTPKARRRK
jgi:hypothetical protein